MRTIRVTLQTTDGVGEYHEFDLGDDTELAVLKIEHMEFRSRILGEKKLYLKLKKGVDIADMIGDRS